MLNLKHDSKIPIIWFIDNVIELHPKKSQLMVMSNNEVYSLRTRSQSDVVLLGIKIGNELTFMKHISTLCTKAFKRLYAINHISKFFFAIRKN